MALLWAEARIIGFRDFHRFEQTTTRKVVCHEPFVKCEAEWIHHSQRSLEARAMKFGSATRYAGE